MESITHIGISVSNLDKSINFYKDILNLSLVSRMTMKGESTDKLFNEKNLVVNLAYLTSKDKNSPSIELLEFNKEIERQKSSLLSTSISEVCFIVEDIDKTYSEMLAKNVRFLSEPQYFDFTEFGGHKSKAVYFYDLDDNILELMQIIK